MQSFKQSRSSIWDKTYDRRAVVTELLEKQTPEQEKSYRCFLNLLKVFHNIDAPDLGHIFTELGSLKTKVIDPVPFTSLPWKGRGIQLFRQRNDAYFQCPDKKARKGKLLDLDVSGWHGRRPEVFRLGR